MKMTLLAIVQDIMSDMSSDVVNSIDDTEESRQVAQIVKSTFFAMISNRNWPHLKRTIQLEASGDLALPTHMTLQDEITELVFVNYNKIKSGETRKRYEKIHYLEPEAFLRRINPLNNDEDNIDVIIDENGIELNIFNDRAPTRYTSFNDVTLVFDSYDSAVDATLQSSKLQAQAYVAPAWIQSDTAIPDLPDEAFTALLEEAKSRSMFKLKQTEDTKAEQESVRQQRWLSRKAWKVKGGVQYRNFGRQTLKMQNPAFDKHNAIPTE